MITSFLMVAGCGGATNATEPTDAPPEVSTPPTLDSVCDGAVDARPLDGGGSAALESPDDAGWFSIEVDGPTFVRLDLEGQMAATFCDAEGAPLTVRGTPLVWLPTPGIRTFSVTWEPFPDPTFPTDGVPYTVSASFEAPGVEPDSVEAPGSVYAAPTGILLEAPGDVDHVEVSVEPGTLLWLHEAGMAGFDDPWSVEVFLPDGTPIARSADTNVVVPLAVDRIVVAMTTNGPAGTWTSLRADPVGFWISEQEPNEDEASALVIDARVYNTVSGTLSAGDVDCWTVLTNSGDALDPRAWSRDSLLEQFDLDVRTLAPEQGVDRSLVCLTTDQPDCGVGCWYRMEPMSHDPNID